MSKIVIALGGNALGNTLVEQEAAARHAAGVIAALVEEGHQVVVSHGNGPQVGMIYNAMAGLAAGAEDTAVPLSTCVAMSQGYIGFDLQNCLREELERLGMRRGVSTVLTQVCVDGDDPAFANPTKPIGAFLSPDEAEQLRARGHAVVEDSGRGYRRVVPSPRPVDIVEIDSVRALVDSGQVVIACGGGGVPVVRRGNRLEGVNAVVDKDFASARLAELLDADFLVILTAVEKVAVNFGKPDQKWLDAMTVEEAREYIAQGQFAPGSMLPKVEAAIAFASAKPGRRALITLLEKARDGINGKTGTAITA